MRYISFIVGPSMLLELLGTASLIADLHQFDYPWMIVVASLFLGVVWVVTIIATLTHNQLLSGYDRDSIYRLIKINWLRTISWTVRTAMLGFALFFSNY
ncbi:MAG TPA: hypothetical protein ACFCUD_02665 [Cyclobacteriaceae bacterium]